VTAKKPQHLPNFSIQKKEFNINDFILSKELLINEDIIIDPFYCNECQSIFKNFSSCNNCKKLICLDCIGKYCKFCKNYYYECGIDKNLISLLNNIKLKCPLICHNTFLYKNLKEHVMKYCPNTTLIYTCFFCEKKFEIIPNKTDLSLLEIHNQKCEDVLLQCSFCEIVYKRNEIKNHLNVCQEKFIYCTECKLEYKLKFESPHKEFFCKVIKKEKEDINKIIEEFKNKDI